MMYNMVTWMTGGMWGFGFLGFLISVLVLVNLFLLAFWLWEQIQKK